MLSIRNYVRPQTIEEAYEGRWIFSNVKFAFYNKCEEIKSLIPYMEIIKNLANYDELQEIVSLPINDENKEKNNANRIKRISKTRF